MKATEILIEEHRLILKMIEATERAVKHVEQGVPFRPEFFIEATDFFKGFADGCHHKKEEDILFKAMASHGVPVQGGPIGVMLDEHQEGRAHVRSLRTAAQQWVSGEEDAKQAVVDSARAYANLLRQHIWKEDNILFPMAERNIPSAQFHQLVEAFERVEHEETGEGVHEKYVALAKALIKESQDVAS